MQNQAWHNSHHTFSCPFRLHVAQESGLILESLAQVVLCKIASAQFGTMFAVGQTTYAYYAKEGLPADPAGFQPAALSRCELSLYCPEMQSTFSSFRWLLLEQQRAGGGCHSSLMVCSQQKSFHLDSLVILLGILSILQRCKP